MVQNVLISTSCAVSVLALGIALAALKAADPLMIRRLRADLGTIADQFKSSMQDLREVELPRIQNQAEAVLERAELKFESAESKRKSIAAREQHAAARDPGGNGSADWLNESLSRSERAAALERFARGGR